MLNAKLINYLIISGSTQIDSQSAKVSAFIRDQLSSSDRCGKAEIINLAKVNLPLWSNSDAKNDWPLLSEQITNADAIVLVTPEWNGMSCPAIRNLFIYCEHEFAHKPALLVAVSSGNGGAVPIAELRLNTYKNSRICYLPEHLIIRNVRSELDAIDLDNPLQQRVIYNLALLTAYALALRQVRHSMIIDHDKFTYGM